MLPPRRCRTRSARATAAATGDQGGAVAAQPEVGWESLRDTAAIDPCAKKYDLGMFRPMVPARVSHWRGRYLSIRYTERLGEAGLEPSVGSVGDSYDNALAETIIGLFKTEVIHRLGPWKSTDAVEWETLKWVDWFNNRRLLGPVGNIPPAEAERNFYETIEGVNMVA